MVNMRKSTVTTTLYPDFATFFGKNLYERIEIVVIDNC